MSEAEVTFVNGIAESQTTEGESAIPDDDRAAAIAAVKEALKEEGETAAKEAKRSLDNDPLRPRDNTERDANGQFVKKDKEQAPKEKEPEEDEHALRRVLNERKQIAAVKAQQNQEFQQRAQQLRQYEANLQREAQRIKQESAKLEMLRKDPARAIRENGWDPEEFILGLAREGTPEGQAMRQQREFQAKLQEMENWKKAQEEQLVQQQQEYKQRQARAYREQVEQTFTALALNEEKHPHLAEMYQDAPDELLAKADVIAEKYRKLTGKEASLEDVAEYLEERAEKWYKSISTKRGPQAKTPVTQGKSTQGNATGRTLTPDVSSERRSLGASLKDLDGEERLAAAREAVGAAFRASGEQR